MNLDEHQHHPKYQALINTGKEKFWKYGVKRVSVEEICKAAGVSKMTFYKFFGNKIELAKHIYGKLVDEGMKKFYTLLNQDTSAANKIKGMIQMKVDAVHNISQEFVKDLYQNPELGLKDYVEEITRESWITIMEYFREAQQKGIFRKDLHPEFLIYYGQKITEMVTDENLIRVCGSTEEVIKELTIFFAYGISEHS